MPPKIMTKMVSSPPPEIKQFKQSKQSNNPPTCQPRVDIPPVLTCVHTQKRKFGIIDSPRGWTSSGRPTGRVEVALD